MESLDKVETFNLEPPPNKTLSEGIADNLREIIIQGKLAPGSRLQEVDVALSYQTSRTPVREALRQLESEGFLVIRPRRGAIVAPITAKDITEFYEIKTLLEGYAARLSANILTDYEIDRMEMLNKELEQRYKRQDITGMLSVHNEFHEIFVNACGNERLCQLIAGLVKQFRRFRIALSYTDAVAESIKQHSDIVKAFRLRDPEQIEDSVKKNSSMGKERLLSKLRGI